MVFFCFGILVVLLNIPGISICRHTLFLSSPHFRFIIIIFIRDLCVSCNDSLIGSLTVGTKQLPGCFEPPQKPRGRVRIK